VPPVARESLLSLEAYARQRDAYRAEIIAHKKRRTLHLGEHVTLQFEDERTIRYQIQEMLRIERVFEEKGIQDELDAYNPLVPDGSNLKATMLIEYPDAAERQQRLRELKGLERGVWLRVGSGAKIQPVADEDLERENDEKTSAVHFLRFELDEAARRELKQGGALSAGVDHPAYRIDTGPLPEELRASLARDLA
jgi:hypothetical protein